MVSSFASSPLPFPLFILHCPLSKLLYLSSLSFSLSYPSILPSLRLLSFPCFPFSVFPVCFLATSSSFPQFLLLPSPSTPSAPPLRLAPPSCHFPLPSSFHHSLHPSSISSAREEQVARLCCATWWLPARNSQREGGREGELVAHVSALALGLVPCDGRKEEDQEEVEEEE